MYERIRRGFAKFLFRESAHNFNFVLSFSFSGSLGPGHPSTTSPGLLPRNVSFSIYTLDENTKLKTGLSFRRSPKTLIPLLADSCFRDFVLGLLYGNKFQASRPRCERVIKNSTWKYRDFNCVLPRRSKSIVSSNSPLSSPPKLAYGEKYRFKSSLITL